MPTTEKKSSSNNNKPDAKGADGRKNNTMSASSSLSIGRLARTAAHDVYAAAQMEERTRHAILNNRAVQWTAHELVAADERVFRGRPWARYPVGVTLGLLIGHSMR